MWPWVTPEGEELGRQLTSEVHTALCAVFDERSGMSETPKVGDRVRVSYEGVVGSVRPRLLGFKGGPMCDVSQLQVEVLERADDPARDPVGTVRRFGGRSFVRVLDFEDWPWKDMGYQGGNGHDSMVGCPIIGAVPGTPAAEVAKEPLAEWERKLLASGDPVETARREAPDARPTAVAVGPITAESPEPDRSKVYVEYSGNGDEWSYTDGWGFAMKGYDWSHVGSWSTVLEDWPETFPWHLADGE